MGKSAHTQTRPYYQVGLCSWVAERVYDVLLTSGLHVVISDDDNDNDNNIVNGAWLCRIGV